MGHSDFVKLLGQLASLTQQQRVQMRSALDDLPDGHPNSPTCGHLKFPHPERSEMTG